MKNYWYIACPSSRLGDKPRATQVFDEPIVVYRDTEGRAHALEDRCCHRGVELSKGRITKTGLLACGYHGWEYDSSGCCVHVPSFVEGTRVPNGFRVKSYPVCEQDHYVWVWMGEGEPQGLPAPIRGAHQYSWKQGTVPVQCNAGLFLENMLDGAHPVFAHKGTHPAYFFNVFNGFKEYAYEVRVNDAGFTLFYPPTEHESQPIPETADSVASFVLPDRAEVLQRGARTDFYNIIHMVPQDEHSCRVEWMTRQPGDEPGMEWTDEEPPTMRQDRVLQESAQRNYGRDGDGFEKHVPADYATLLVRKILNIARESRWPEGRDRLIQRKLVQVRQ